MGLEGDYSPPSCTDVKECVELYQYTSIRLHGVVLSEAQGQLYLCILVHASQERGLWAGLPEFDSQQKCRLLFASIVCVFYVTHRDRRSFQLLHVSQFYYNCWIFK
jgi:hypothetical protein